MMMKKNWIVGTRGSKLALKQTQIVIDELKNLYPEYNFILKIIKTKGDTLRDIPLGETGSKGLFVSEIEEELLNNKIDLAVHSMKDLPSELKTGLTIGAMLPREDPRDVFISNTFKSIAEVKEKGIIGTSSMRRKVQILNNNSKVSVFPLRGNVETRIKKIEKESLDGIVLAYAGVKRMGFENTIKEILPLEVMTPPAGQGAIGIEVRNEEKAIQLLEPLNDANTFHEVIIERKLQSMIGGGCNVPLGIHAHIHGGTVYLYIFYAPEDKKPLLRVKEKAPINNVEPLLLHICALINK